MLERFYSFQNVLVTLRFLTLCASVGNKECSILLMNGVTMKFTVLVCFFDHKGIVDYKFIVQGQTVNQQCYLEVLTKLRESVVRKRPGLWRDKWILHRDNAAAHDV